jgi:hypothetical protein
MNPSSDGAFVNKSFMLCFLTLGLGACNEQNFNERRIDSLAVVLGDFDDIRSVLTGLEISTAAYDGFIVQATYEPEEDRTLKGEMALTVEGLLTNTDNTGRIELNLYQAAFFNSGTRGLNLAQYNDPLLPDSSLLEDPALLDVACSYVNNGNTLVVSDWAYELIEYCWPDAIDFMGEDELDDNGVPVPDLAQLGQAEKGVVMSLGGDDKFKKDIGESSLAIDFNYSDWTVIEGVGADTTVLLSGDISYQPDSASPIELAIGTPTLVRFNPGEGQVLFSSFHWSAQSMGLAESLLLASVEGLRVGSGEETTTEGE